MDIRLALMTGIDIPIPECQVSVHQPTIKEISYIGENNYMIGAQVLTIDKAVYEQDMALPPGTTNFSIFLSLINDKTQRDKKEAVLDLLHLLFPSHKITMTPRSLLLNKNDENVIIDENNFPFIQAILSKIFCLSASGQDSFNPGNDAAKKIADKLAKARKKVAELKQAERGDGSMLAQYLSILTVGLESMSLEDLLNTTIFQLNDLMERYSLYVNWDLDVRQRLAGGKPDSSPDNWMKIIH